MTNRRLAWSLVAAPYFVSFWLSGGWTDWKKHAWRSGVFSFRPRVIAADARQLFGLL
jgi:hypothetical protein